MLTYFLVMVTSRRSYFQGLGAKFALMSRIHLMVTLSTIDGARFRICCSTSATSSDYPSDQAETAASDLSKTGSAAVVSPHYSMYYQGASNDRNVGLS
ncbi:MULTISPECIES: hypothetical protein [unclassified Rhizobium]|uniref:hypothetical protein n=1 Tax=unclassified Rhizobium TaxID=2613769 RepID=UPI000F7442C0|nr:MULTISPECIES: hypothetical protein [unclassified Rhizobium]